MDDRQKREQYVEALSRRLHDTVRREAPKGMGRVTEHWQRLVTHDREVLRLADKYEKGEVGKTQLDAAAIAYLHAFREEAQEYRINNPAAKVA